MITIHKYNLKYTDVQTVDLPRFARILRVEEQLEVPRMWVELNKDLPFVKRTFCIFGTGAELPSDKILNHIGTWFEFNGLLVWHLYEDLTTLIEEETNALRRPT